MVSNRDLDKLVENWLADIKILEDFNCEIGLGEDYYDLNDFYYNFTDYPYDIPRLAKDFPVFRGEYEPLNFWIVNERHESLYVSFPMDQISSPLVELRLKDSYLISFYGDVSILSTALLKLCYRFPNETIRYYNHQYYADPHFRRHSDYMYAINEGYNMKNHLKIRNPLRRFIDIE